jgi:hypothetical protein
MNQTFGARARPRDFRANLNSYLSFQSTPGCFGCGNFHSGRIGKKVSAIGSIMSG